MPDFLNNVDQRTQLVGENRLELLLFYLGGRQSFALNVFKVQEVIKLPRLTAVPGSHSVVRGVTHWRGRSIPAIDLRQAIGGQPLPLDDQTNLIVCEYNRTVQGFLVGAVDRIINLNWDSILPPPSGTGRHHYLTAFTRLDERIVEIIDVEKVLAEIRPYDTAVSEELLDDGLEQLARDKLVLVVDDSATALGQARETLHHLGLNVITANNGREALLRLQQRAHESGVGDLLMVVTDAEMPEMDGYRLTTEIRRDPQLADLPVVMHTSLSGSFNQALVDKVGCDFFLSKFRPDDLAQVAQNYLRRVQAGEPLRGG